MKIKMGPYKNWIGPYQIADIVFFWLEKYPDDKLDKRWDYQLHDRFGNWLAKTWVMGFCEWIASKRKRKIKIHIDNYDVWSMEHTLSMIILPMLKELKANKMGYGWIDDEDAPEHIRSTAPGAREGINNSWDWDRYAQDRHDYVMREMIWTFQQLSLDDHESQFYDHSECENPADDINTQIRKLKVDQAGLDAHNKRIDNGLRLFAKYFRSLWD